MLINSLSDVQPFVYVLGWIPAAIALGSAVASYFQQRAANRAQQRQTTQYQTDPAFTPLQNAILPIVQQRLNQGLPQGYEQQGVSGINRAYEGGQQSLENVLTSRGLGSSPIAGSALARYQGDRISDIGRFRANIPMIEDEYRNRNMQTALQTLGMGRPNVSTTYQGGGSALGSAFNSGASMLGWLYGTGAFGGRPPIQTTGYTPPYSPYPTGNDPNRP